MGFAELTPALVSPEEYLLAEAHSELKHEYVGGVVYAMAGGRNQHQRIATNALVALANRVAGGGCQAFNSDTRVRVRLPTHTRFYYPDAQVSCRPGPPDLSYQDDPDIIVEVLSESTRRTDELEKRDAYLTIPSLNVYILLEQSSASATVWRRHSSGFTRERWLGLDGTIPLPELQTALPLSELYRGVTFSEPHAEVIGPADYLA